MSSSPLPFGSGVRNILNPVGVSALISVSGGSNGSLIAKVKLLSTASNLFW